MSKASQCYHRKCSIPCRCQWEGQSAASQIIDLSFDGAIIAQCEPAPELGSNVVVELEVGTSSLPFPGKVIYAQSMKGGPFGVHFTGNCDDNLARLMPLYES